MKHIIDGDTEMNCDGCGEWVSCYALWEVDGNKLCYKCQDEFEECADGDE